MNNERQGTVTGVNGNLVRVKAPQGCMQNEIVYISTLNTAVKGEIIRITLDEADVQVYEDTTGIRPENKVSFSGALLSVELGPGLLGGIFDGLQNPLPELAAQCGFFLQRGVYLNALDRKKKWSFIPSKNTGETVIKGDSIGYVQEGPFRHQTMVPLGLSGAWTVEWILEASETTVEEPVARLKNPEGLTQDVYLKQSWPIRIPIHAFKERLRPVEPMVTQIRTIDSLFPVARGGTYCIPGPFGAGKTVLQQLTSRFADVDIVIIAACGERAGEVVETLREFPELLDPKTGRPLMERTVIICNTSSMPVAAREASVYTAVTIAEYFRQMGLHVLLLADSTSRWAQALREMSGRLEEIPGEEAFPAYLESAIAAFYERAGLVRLNDDSLGSVTIGGTVSPAGGNFEEPVTQSTLKVVGAFHGLSRERSDARRYPAIHPLESWSTYSGVLSTEDRAWAAGLLATGANIGQMMKVVGEEGTSIDDFVQYLKAECFDAVYLQQNAYNEVDAATTAERQREVFSFLKTLLSTPQTFASRDLARRFFQEWTQLLKDWNFIPLHDEKFVLMRDAIAAKTMESAHA